ncbi:MAG: hypothetical protein KDI37_05835, partial [Xanthomonadales bacterium]|nr:hypothetical protein [Xanthomonadales bacterium]
RIIKLNDLHVGALTSTQQWLVEGSNEIAVLLIAEDLTGLVYELHALRIDGRVSSRLVWSGTEHPGSRHASLETDWAVFRASDGLAAIHMQTGERRLLSSTIPDQLLAQTED